MPLKMHSTEKVLMVLFWCYGVVIVLWCCFQKLVDLSFDCLQSVILTVNCCSFL